MRSNAFSGGHLRELQSAVKDPISNFGVVLGEVTKRGKSAMGMGTGNVLANDVHANLVDPAGKVCKAVDLFGSSIEKLLIKHGTRPFSRFTYNTIFRTKLIFSLGKHIIHEQFLLKRIADSSIDIYGMVCALSRCSKSLNEGLPSAMQEELITKVIV